MTSVHLHPCVHDYTVHIVCWNDECESGSREQDAPTCTFFLYKAEYAPQPTLPHSFQIL